MKHICYTVLDIQRWGLTTGAIKTIIGQKLNFHAPDWTFDGKSKVYIRDIISKKLALELEHQIIVRLGELEDLQTSLALIRVE